MRRPIQPIPRRAPGGAQRAELKRLLDTAYNAGVNAYDQWGDREEYLALCPYPDEITRRKERSEWVTGYLDRKEEYADVAERHKP